MQNSFSIVGAATNPLNWNNDYRHSYQGSEKDDEIKGEGNSYTTHFRMLDPRIGRWWSVDPSSSELPWQSPYVSMDNNPIIFNDPKGDKIKYGKGEASFQQKRRIKNQVRLECKTNSVFKARHDSYKGWQNRNRTLVYEDSNANDVTGAALPATAFNPAGAVYTQTTTENGTKSIDYVQWDIDLAPVPPSYIRMASDGLTRETPVAVATPPDFKPWRNDPITSNDIDIIQISYWLAVDPKRAVVLRSTSTNGSTMGSDGTYKWEPNIISKKQVKIVKKAIVKVSDSDIKRKQIILEPGTNKSRRPGVEIEPKKNS